MDSLLAAARERVRQFVKLQPELRLSEDVPIQSVTNRVLYGERAGDRIVFKVFAQKARKWQEERALQ